MIILQACENELVPKEFLALTLQKYFVRFDSELTGRVVSVRVESSTIFTVKSVSLASWNL